MIILSVPYKRVHPDIAEETLDFEDLDFLDFEDEDEDELEIEETDESEEQEAATE